jgi:hypothetical protein
MKIINKNTEYTIITEIIEANNKVYTRITDDTITWYGGNIHNEYLSDINSTLTTELEKTYKQLTRENKLNNILNENY